MKNSLSQTIRGRTLQMLQQDTYISGQVLSEKLGVSRTTVWKHIQKLRAMGYQIESKSNVGYRLLKSPGQLIPDEIQRNLQTKQLGRKIVFFEEIDSTNSQAKAVALNHPEGTIFLADAQQAGRGRLGRQWSSVPGKGIWCSILLKPALRPTVASQFPLLTAVAIAEVLRKYQLEATIKWPNDILIKGQKICGILTEMGAELDKINYLVIGFGLNVKHEESDFPEELQSIATSVEIELGKEVSRVQVLCDILLQLEIYYQQFINQGFEPILKLWKEYNCTLGKETKVSRYNQPPLYGKAIDINPDGSLVLQLADKQIISVFSGEIQSA